MRQFSIADQTLSVRAEGFSPESEAILSRKYAAFERAKAPSADLTIEVHRDPELGDSEAPDTPLLGQDMPSLLIRARGLVGDWQETTLKAKALNDLIHPIENMIRFALTRTLLQKGGGCFHAAGVEDASGDGAFVILGESEAGKTTLATILGREHTLSDEMPALLHDGEAWRVHATPFWGDMAYGESSGSRVLRGLFVLEGKGAFQTRELSPSETQQALMARVFNYSDEECQSQAALGLATKLAQEVPAFGLVYPKEIERDLLLAALESTLLRGLGAAAEPPSNASSSSVAP